jgi:putative PIN family toxin of toxin-antitoxin system
VSKQHAVFDCNVFAQALLSPQGPAGACMRAGLNGAVVVCLSRFVISEIRNLPNKPMPAQLGMTLDQVDELLDKLRPVAMTVDEPPVVFEHPIDPRDGPYIDLAVAAGAHVITSRDKHLLNLVNPAKPWSADFRARFPWLRVIPPEVFLQELRDERVERGDQ